MSNVMYAYRFSRDKLWEVINEIDTWYKEHHISYITARRMTESDEHFHNCSEIVDVISDNTKTTLQLFEIDGYYYMRVLEDGYFFLNNCSEFKAIERVFYDDRTDLTEEEKQWRWLVDALDDLIKKRQYLLYPLTDKEQASRYMWDLFAEKWSKEKR